MSLSPLLRQPKGFGSQTPEIAMVENKKPGEIALFSCASSPGLKESV